MLWKITVIFIYISNLGFKFQLFLTHNLDYHP